MTEGQKFVLVGAAVAAGAVVLTRGGVMKKNPSLPIPNRVFSKTVIHPVLPRNKYYVVGSDPDTYGNWYEKLECWQVHTGIDLNANTGGNSDAGDYVYCVADGEVISAEYYSGWGGIIVVRHPQFGVRTRYAHINNFRVKVGDFVKMGQVIAQIAPGNANWSAHLHFDVYAKELAANHWCFCSRACVSKNYLDPSAWLIKQKALTFLPTDD